MRQISLAVFILMFMVWTADSYSQESPWPMFRHDLKHTGRTDYTGPADSIPAWTFQANDAIASSPSIGHDGTIYFGAGGYYGGGGDSSLYALNPDGSLKWYFRTDKGAYAAGIFSSPMIGPDGTIYFGALDEYVYAIEDSVTYAKLKWKYKMSHQVYSSPALSDDGTLYVGGLDFTFHALRASDGFNKWTYTTNWCVLSSPAIGDDGIIYVGSKDHNLYAFVDSLDEPIWAAPVGTFYDGHLIDASPAIGTDGTIYVGTDQYGAWGQTPFPVDTSFWAINPDGSIKWAFETDDGVESSPGIGPDGTVYFGSYDSCLYAVTDSGSQGALKWKFKTDGPVDGSPTIDGDGIIYFGSRDSTLYALFPNGDLKWKYKTDGGLESSPTIDDNGYLYIGGFDGKLYAFGTGAPDVGVKSVDMFPQVQSGKSYYPAATVNNYRSTPQSFEAVCAVDSNGVVIYSDTVPVTNLPGSQSLEVVFEDWTVNSDIGLTYNVTVNTIHPTDENDYNDEETIQVVSVEYAGLCGDANGDESVNVSDGVWLINYIFASGSPPSPLACGDADSNGRINISDAVQVVNYVYLGGDPPGDCSPGDPDWHDGDCGPFVP